MRESFKMTTEDNEEITVDFSIVKNESAERPYGISASIRDSKEQKTVAEERFFTYGEAVATVDMLCRYEVTPCTLCEII